MQKISPTNHYVVYTLWVISLVSLIFSMLKFIESTFIDFLLLAIGIIAFIAPFLLYKDFMTEMDKATYYMRNRQNFDELLDKLERGEQP